MSHSRERNSSPAPVQGNAFNRAISQAPIAPYGVHNRTNVDLIDLYASDRDLSEPETERDPNSDRSFPLSPRVSSSMPRGSEMLEPLRNQEECIVRSTNFIKTLIITRNDMHIAESPFPRRVRLNRRVIQNMENLQNIMKTESRKIVVRLVKKFQGERPAALTIASIKTDTEA